MISGTIKKKDLKTFFQFLQLHSVPTFPTISIFQLFQIVPTNSILFHCLNFPKVPRHLTQVGMQRQWTLRILTNGNVCLHHMETFINPLKGSVLNPLHPQVPSLDIKGSLSYHTIEHLVFEGHLHWNNAHLVLWRTSPLEQCASCALKDISTGRRSILCFKSISTGNNITTSEI